jgi:glutamate racemase
MNSSSKAELPIGIFDSGVGGLTVFSAIAKQLPHENLIYLGDTARVPYGTRSAETVCRYAQRVAGHLVRIGVKALVVACNTATTWALPQLQAAGKRHNIPVFGVIEPGALEAVKASMENHIGVIGTEGTISGKRYITELRKHDPSIRVEERACPLFVPFIEEGWLEDPITKLVAQRYLESMCGPDVIILGCTHYPLIKPILQEVLPKTTFVNSATATAKAVAKQLEELGLSRQKKDAEFRFLVTDNLERFRRVGYYFIGKEPSPIELVDLSEDDARSFST